MSTFPPRHAAPITPSDSADLPASTEWISFANSGTQTLNVIFVGDSTAVSILLPSGKYEMCIKKVFNSGTTVTAIVGYWT